MPHRISRDDAGIVRNLSPAVVVSIPVAVGDVVEEGDVVAVVEAMKMESSLTAPFRGRVKEVLVGENVHVAAQAPLLALEPLDGDGRAQPPASASRSRPRTTTGAPAPERCHENLRRMRVARARLRHRRGRGRAHDRRPARRVRATCSAATRR